ncbi:MAG TPA: amidohydrolase family protein [Actinocrinis sp.]|nr:amidohydrolase family protein [Actinocrinis sp.]
MIIDADAHVVEPWDMWQRWASPQPRVRTPRRGAERWGVERPAAESRVHPAPEGPGRAARRPAAESAPADLDLAHYRDEVAISSRMDSRLARMDHEGVDAAVILPSQGLAVGAVPDAGLAAAMADSYNHWVRELCSRAPKRLFPVAILPQQDVGRAVKAVRQAHETGFAAVLVRPNPVGGRALDDRSNDPLWAEIDDCGLAVMVHEETGFATGATTGTDRFDTGVSSALVSHPVEQMLAVTSFAFGGILARFSALRVGFLEAGCGWLPYWLDRMDKHTEQLGWEVPWLDMRPSDYFRRQCFVSCAADDPFIPSVIDFAGPEVLMFSTEFPHSNHTMTGAVDRLRARTDIPAAAFEGIAGGNCRRLLAPRGAALSSPVVRGA